MTTLGDRKADIEVLKRELREHRLDCLRCSQRKLCEEWHRINRERADAVRDVRNWFAPGPDQEPLFEELR